VEDIAFVQGFQNSLIVVRIMMPSYSSAVTDNAYFFLKEKEALFKAQKMKWSVCGRPDLQNYLL
jgi:hypothetical protein